MEKVIIFDLGGVLIDWDPRYLYTSYFETQEAMEFFLSEVCTMEWNEEQDGGRTIAEANAILIERYPEYKTEILAFYSEWTTMLRGAIPEIVDILQTIRKNYRQVYALTNWSAETFPIAISKYPFLEWFDGILVSGQEQLKKPDPKIYQLLLERYALDSNSCIFIDDNLRNVKAAELEGITSIHYKNPVQLKDQLSIHGINV
ncbi:MAG: HAD family phosphatase [Saprospiraceae bacterium]|nr:HAD family phosphatase [Saprospiraceae bacterium]